MPYFALAHGRERIDGPNLAAAVVGDDFRRNQAGVELAPETWTHGSSEQRVRWVSADQGSGLPAACDAFGAG